MLSIDKAIQEENKTAKKEQKIVDTEMICDDISFSELFCGNTKHIKKQLLRHKKSVEYHKQLSEWLEELKSIKEMDLSIPQHFTKEQSDWIKAYCIQRNKEFYNKAIDEAICKVEKHKTNGYVTGITNNPFEFGACQMADDIVKILKQLKAGAKDED